MNTANQPKISLAELHPADILLCHRTDELSQLIQQVDQGGYSHAVVYIGEESGEHRFVHATWKGIKNQTLEEILEEESIDRIDVVRWHDEGGQVLGSKKYPVAPIIELVKSYVGGPYYKSTLLLGGLVILVVDEVRNPTLQKIARVFGGLIESFISKLFIQRKGKTPMVCVEVATASYWNADASDNRSYAIKVKIAGNRKKVDLKAFTKKESTTILDRFKKILQGLQPISNVISDSPLILNAGSPLLPAETCTLRDLSTSPSLKMVGNLYEDNGSEQQS